MDIPKLKNSNHTTQLTTFNAQPTTYNLQPTTQIKMAKTEKLNRDTKRELALEMYLNTDKSQKEICKMVGWTEATFINHKEKGQWAMLKGAGNITTATILKKLYLKLESLVDADKIDVDALVKITRGIDFMSNKKVTISHHINCAKEFTTWLLSRDAALAKQINNYQREFINGLVSNG
jgi:hypothetical protein